MLFKQTYILDVRARRAETRGSLDVIRSAVRNTFTKFDFFIDGKFARFDNDFKYFIPASRFNITNFARYFREFSVLYLP